MSCGLLSFGDFAAISIFRAVSAPFDLLFATYQIWFRMFGRIAQCKRKEDNF